MSKNKFVANSPFLNEFFKNRIVLLIVLFGFIILKLPHLNLPFYWDESWPYVPAVKELFRNGISLLPNAIDPDYSRGHPLFFHASCALWMHVFGTSNLSLHCFAMSISVLFLISIYEVALKLFNGWVAVMALSLTATCVMYFVQSSFVLLEILIAYLAFMSLYFYSQGKYWLCTFTLTALFFTKESGVIAGLVIGADAFFSLFRKDISIKERWKRFLPVVIATTLIVAFFLLQKKLRGWYFYPLHADSILRDWSIIWYRFRTATLALVLSKFWIFVYFVILALLAVVVVIKNKLNKKYLRLLLFIPLLIVTYCIVDEPLCQKLRIDNSYGLTAFIALFAFFTLYFYTLYSMSDKRFYSSAVQSKFLVLTGIFIILFVIYSSTVFYTARYLLSSIVPLLFLVAVFLDSLIRYSYRGFYFVVIVIIVVIACVNFKNSNDKGDVELGFADGVKTQLDVVRYFEKNKLYTSHICTGSYLTQVSLKNQNSGFLETTQNFEFVKYDLEDASKYVIFNNIEPDIRHDNVAGSTSFELVYKSNHGSLWAEVYKRKE